MNRTLVMVALVVSIAGTGCGAFEDALTSHARPAATAAGFRLDQEELGHLMANSPMPDSSLTPYWAGEFARLWADFVVLSTLYEDPDTTRSLDYTRLMEDGRHLSAIAVMRYRDSVVMAGIEPTEEELRAYFDLRQPYTRLDVRRIVLAVPSDGSDTARDSVIDEARAVRERLVGGADFVTVARTRSSEPAQARGQVLAYQGHDDFPPAADSVVFALRPGEISPVFAGDDEVVIYRIEARREPDFDASRDQLYRRVVEEREEERQKQALESAVGGARRAVMQGATDRVSEIARDPDLAVTRIPDGMKLVTWEGGDLSVEEVRRLFLVRADMKRVFAEASEDELHDYLMQLARDEILITAATRSGAAVNAEEREALSEALAEQLSHIAARMGLTSQLVANPRFDLDDQGYYFLQRVMARSRALPWLGEFRVVLDPVFPVWVDDSGVRSAARHAADLRAAGIGPTVPETEAPQAEDGGTRVEVG
ncbi:MAG: peptidyl-prolyl cis-trans isomerase [Gemmatimonadetes bacterium]|nr:peptidyl-prolyl cis-trans isomerase [Gemmatimonadota bacterium]